MLFEWTEDIINYFVDASRYTGFHERLAHLVLPYLDGEDEVLDIGCGLGLLDFALSEGVKSITAVDEDPAVINHMRMDVDMRGTRNVFPRVGRLSDLAGETWDVALLSFFGTPGDELREAMAMARRKVLVISHGEDTDRGDSMVKPNAKRVFSTEVEAFFKAEGIYYRKHTARLNFGQPLKSTADALKFFRAYIREDDPAEKKERLDALMGRIEETGEEVFPYFFPKPRSVAIFICEV
jgi:SAM-dependent methyltransferase